MKVVYKNENGVIRMREFTKPFTEGRKLFGGYEGVPEYKTLIHEYPTAEEAESTLVKMFQKSKEKDYKCINVFVDGSIF